MNLKPLIAIVAAAALFAAGSVAVAVVGFFSAAEDEAVDYVPRNATFYASVFLDPSVPQKMALDDLLGHFPQAPGRAEARDRIVDLIDQGLRPLGMSFDADIDPWLGKQIAFFATVPNFMDPSSAEAEPAVAMLVATEDGAATEAAIDKAQSASGQGFERRSVDGVDYRIQQDGTSVGIVDDFLVTGTETGFRAVVEAQDGESLGESDRYKNATAGLTEDRLATFFFDASSLAAFFPPGVAMAPGLGTVSPDQLSGTAIVYARGDGIVFEASSKLPDDPQSASLAQETNRESKALGAVPEDSWAAIGIAGFGDLGEALTAGIAGSPFPGAFPLLPPGSPFDIGELTEWMGDAALFARGKNPAGLGGGLVIEGRDRDAAVQGFKRLKALARAFGAREGGSSVVGDFSIHTSATTEPIYVYERKGRVVIAYGDDAASAALPGKPNLGGSQALQRARRDLGDGFALAGVIDIQPLISLIEANVPSDPTYENDVKPWFEPLSLVMFGSRIDGDRVVTRMVVGVR